jgi:hypothetical protein
MAFGKGSNYFPTQHKLNVLGPLEKLRKATISFVMSVRPSDRMEQLGSKWTDCYEILHLSIFLKSAEKILVSLKSVKSNG